MSTKTKPIRLFTCPNCGRMLVHRTRRTSLVSICENDSKDTMTSVIMVAEGHKTNESKSRIYVSQQ